MSDRHPRSHSRKNIRSWLSPVAAALLLCLSPITAVAQSDVPWHAKSHTHRAVVEVTEWTEDEVDTAAVRLAHAGVMQAEARDLRIYDAAGERVPYEIAYHHPERDTLVKFRASVNGNNTFYFYFGSDSAEVDPYRVVHSDSLGITPPQPAPAADGWVPRAGLVLTTMRRPIDVDNPETIDEFRALMQESTALDGAGWRTNISDGLNPFGDSDHFLSIYQGWLRIPEDGVYGFCTASNEASFSFMDGKELIHWPGRHTEQRGKHGQKSAMHDLDAGLHYVTYLHEEVLLYQVAFLGYQPPGTDHFVKIPDSLFVQPHRAAIQRYERRGKGVTLMPRIALRDSVWPREREHGQYTRYQFTAEAGGAETDLSKWTFHWTFGDGQAMDGRQVAHVYLTTGEYHATLRATSPDGRTIERNWPVTIFPIEHLQDPFERGERDAYLSRVEQYDAAALDGQSLVELAHFFHEMQQSQDAQDTAERALAHDDVDASHRAELHLLAAGKAGTLSSTWTPPPDDGSEAASATGQGAMEHLAAANQATDDPVQRLHTMARMIRHAGIALDDIDRAAGLHEQAEQTAREANMTRDVKAALREAIIAMGDVRLVARQFDQAALDYRTAEALAEPAVPQSVRIAQIGGYPERIAQALATDRIADATATMRQWRSRFPAHLLTGQPLFWLGKVALQRDEPVRAVQPLELAIERGAGAPFEAEAHWLLAEAYAQLERHAARRAALQALVRTGIASEYRDLAMDALEQEEVEP